MIDKAILTSILSLLSMYSCFSNKVPVFRQITENPYQQYFIGLPGYKEIPSFDASTLVPFRKRINAKMLMEANEYLLQKNKSDKKVDDNDDQNPSSG